MLSVSLTPKASLLQVLFNYVRSHSCRWRLGCALLKMPAVSLLTGNHYNMFNFPDSTHYPYCPAGWAAAGAKDSPRREWARQMAEVAWVEERGIVSEEEAEALAEQERAAGRGPRPRL